MKLSLSTISLAIVIASASGATPIKGPSWTSSLALLNADAVDCGNLTEDQCKAHCQQPIYKSYMWSTTPATPSKTCSCLGVDPSDDTTFCGTLPIQLPPPPLGAPTESCASIGVPEDDYESGIPACLERCAYKYPGQAVQSSYDSTGGSTSCTCGSDNDIICGAPTPTPAPPAGCGNLTEDQCKAHCQQPIYKNYMWSTNPAKTCSCLGFNPNDDTTFCGTLPIPLPPPPLGAPTESCASIGIPEGDTVTGIPACLERCAYKYPGQAVHVQAGFDVHGSPDGRASCSCLPRGHPNQPETYLRVSYTGDDVICGGWPSPSSSPITPPPSSGGTALRTAIAGGSLLVLTSFFRVAL